MNEIAHTKIFKEAVNILPKLLKDKIESYPDLLEHVGNYPDYFDDPTRSEENKKQIDPEWRIYCEYPSNMLATNMHIKNGSEVKPIIKYLLMQMVNKYQEGDFEAFIKFSGCLSHLFGDTTQPAHLDNDIACTFISQLLPVPKDKAFSSFHYHTSVEAVTGNCESLDQLELLGRSIAEVTWSIAQKCQDSIIYCRRFIVPIIQALFDEDMKKAEEAATPSVTIAAQLTADAMFSIMKIAENKFSDSEIEKLSKVDLRYLKPNEEFHDMVYGGSVIDGNKDVPPNNAPVMPASLIDEDGNKFFIKGLGVLPHSGMNGKREVWMRYELPKGVFNIFSATIGMHSDLGTDGAVKFIVELDGKEVYRSETMRAIDISKKLYIDLKDAKELILKVEDANNGSSFWKNHAFWGKPMLRYKS